MVWEGGQIWYGCIVSGSVCVFRGILKVSRGPEAGPLRVCPLECMLLGGFWYAAERLWPVSLFCGSSESTPSGDSADGGVSINTSDLLNAVWGRRVASSSDGPWGLGAEADGRVAGIVRHGCP